MPFRRRVLVAGTSQIIPKLLHRPELLCSRQPAHVQYCIHDCILPYMAVVFKFFL